MEHIVSVDHDELHSMRAVRSEACEGRLRNFMEEGRRQASGEEAPRANRPPAKIQKVIFLLQDHKHFVKYFEPRVASVGPIHHGKPKYQLGEKYKLKLAYEFVKGCGKNIDVLFKPVEKGIKQLRERFEEEVTKKYDDEALAWILFVDGCAILQYIFCATNDKFTELNIKTDSVAFAHQDLFLLENQVPYRLLNLLMSSSGKEVELRKSIESFIRNVTNQQTEPQQNVNKGESSHDSRPEPIGRESSCSQLKQPTHLLDLMRTTLLGVTKEEENLTNKASSPLGFSKSEGGEDPDWQSYRNVQELKAAGINLKRGKESCLRSISFSRRFNFYPGFLSLPPITVDDSTGPKFMNLIAYEMCLDFQNDFGITSYISFLDSLIDEVNDVKDMRKARVLHNFLGSDQEVADLFNEIGTDLVPNTDAYKDVKFKIQRYYNNNWMTYMAQFFHDHFNSPWTILAFLGVLLGLALTALQTWFAIFPHSSDNAKK